MNSRRLLIALVIAMMIFLATVILSNMEGRKPIQIGAILPLTGPSSSNGQTILSGIQLAVDEINRRDGINGHPVEIIVRDSQSDRESAVRVFQKMELEYQPIFYITALSSVATDLAPLAEQHEVVLLALITSDPDITNINDWIYRFWSTANTEVPSVIKVINANNSQNVTMIHIDDEFGSSFREALISMYPQNLRAPNFISYGQVSEITDRVEELMLLDQDFIYIVGFVSHFEQIYKSLREAGYEGAIMTTSAGAAYQTTSNPYYDKLYYPAPIVYRDNYLPAAKLASEYENRYQEPLEHYSAVGYESVRLFSQLINTRDPDRIALHRKLTDGFSFTSVFGNFILAAGEQDFGYELLPAQAVDGKVKYLDL